MLQSNHIIRPSIFFILLALIFGVLITSHTPPMQTADEDLHFFRAYQLAEGKLLPEKVTANDARPKGDLGGTIPFNLLSFAWDFLYQVRESIGVSSKLSHDRIDANLKKYKDIRIDYTNITGVAFPNTGGYSPVPYLPQVMAMWLGKSLNTTILHMFYLGRVLNLLTWIFLVGIAIELLPVGKWLMVTVALFPVSIFQAATFSADAMTNALAFLVIALFVRYMTKQEALTKKQIILVLIPTLALSLCKSGFWIMALLFWLVPVHRFGSRYRYLVGNFLISGISMIAYFIWYKLVSYTIPYIGSTFRPHEMVDYKAQLADVISNPLHLAGAMVHYFFSLTFLADIRTGVGTMGWAEAPVPRFIIILIAALVSYCLVSLAYEKILDLTVKRRLLVVGLLAAQVTVLSATLYVTFTVLHKPVIEGMQGRYFLPYFAYLVPIFAGGLANKKVPRVLKEPYKVVAPVIIIVLIATVVTLNNRYYG